MFTEQEIKELEPSPMPIFDLTLFIEIAKLGEYKIGVVKTDVQKGFTRFKAGQFILFKPYLANEKHGSDTWDNIKYACQHCTTCMPYIGDNGKLTTISSCVYVPLNLISYEIKFQ